MIRNRICLQGYVEAAEVFSRESATSAGVDLGAITDRMLVRRAVQSGDIDDAIARVNDMNPEVSMRNKVIGPEQA